MSKQTVKFSRIQKKLLKSGINITQINGNSFSIASKNDVGLESKILLPQHFEIEEKAIQQLINFSKVSHPDGGHVKCSCATPDFHTGAEIPVGSVVVCSHDMVIPQAIGTDINCGMRLHSLNIDYDTFLSKKDIWLKLVTGDLLEGTRNIPTTALSMEAIFEYGLPDFWNIQQQIKKEGLFNHINFNQVIEESSRLHDSSFVRGNSNYAPQSLINKKRESIRDSGLGTLGGGNHFCEIQMVTEIVDKQIAYQHGIIKGQLVCMIHTGSRDVGHYVGRQWIDKAKALWPTNIKYPENKIFGLTGLHAEEYMKAMHTASHYADLNRAMIAELVRFRTRQVFGENIEAKMVVDVPHNIVIKESLGNVHRKGATPAYENQLLLIPGSMGHDSYLLKGLGNDNWLQSASHGAGRSVSRNEMSYKHKKGNSKELDSIECITLKEERKIEEAPSAYKEIKDVIRSQVEEETVQIIAKFSPILTFKA